MSSLSEIYNSEMFRYIPRLRVVISRKASKKQKAYGQMHSDNFALNKSYVDMENVERDDDGSLMPKRKFDSAPEQGRQ